MKIKRLTVENLKEQNYINIVKLLKIGNYSRADLAYNLDISKPTVSIMVDELIKTGLVYEKCYGESSSLGGKKSILLDINKNAVYFLSLHFRHDNYHIALVNLENEIILEYKDETLVHKDFTKTFKPIVENIKKLKEFAKENNMKIFSIGISAPGKTGRKNNLLIDCMGIPFWKSIPLKQYLEDVLCITVIIDRYACAMLTYKILEEMKLSMPIDSSSVYVYLGDWLGVAVSNNGKILYGTHDTAANYSHTIVTNEEYFCSCGKRGCWQSVASINAFLRELVKRNSKYEGMSFLDIVDNYLKEKDVEETYIEYSSYWVSIGIYNIINTFDPDKIFIGGEMLFLGDKFIEDIRYNIKNKFNSYNFVTDVRMVYNFKDLEIFAAGALSIYDFFSFSLYKTMFNSRHF